MSERFEEDDSSFDLRISDEDIHAAMKDIPGYLDITSGDFKELYQLAFRHALKRLTQLTKASDIMTKKVTTVKRDTPLKEVAKLMADHGVSGVPVIEEDRKIAGVISEKDFLSRMGGKNAKSFMGVVATCLKGKSCVAISIRAKKAEDIMSSPPVTVSEDTSLLDISTIFKEKKINRVPVVDRGGHLVGIISREDIIHTPLLRIIS